MSRIHRYEGEQVVVEFDLSRCIHAGDCTNALPGVFDTKRTGRWVHPDGADAAQVATVCAACPTGALRCVNKSTGEALPNIPEVNTVQVVADGPLYLHARMRIDGVEEPTCRAAICRCGTSRLMPYCDNSHKGCGFRDAGKPGNPDPGEAAGSGGLDIEPVQDGPLHVEGPFTLLDAGGEVVCRASDAWLCRCGGSSNKPYCDGTHKKLGFKG